MPIPPPHQPLLQPLDPAGGDDSIDAARRFFRAFSRADLLTDRGLADFRWVVRPTTGHLVGPVDPELLAADSLALLIPDESQPTLQLLLRRVTLASPSSHDPTTAAPATLPGPTAHQPDSVTQARHAAYHGEAHSRAALRKWLIAEVESVRWHDLVFEGVLFHTANTLAADERGLIQHARTHQRRLADHVSRRLGLTIPEPRVIGIDSDGLDVAADLGAVRLDFTTTARDAAHAVQLIDELLGA